MLIVIRKTDNISINSWVIIKQSIIILSLLHPSGKLETSHPQPWEHEIYWKNKDVPVPSVRRSRASRAPRWYQCSCRNYPQWAVLINLSASCSFQREMGGERRYLVETKHFYISTTERRPSTTLIIFGSGCEPTYHPKVQPVSSYESRVGSLASLMRSDQGLIGHWLVFL